MNAKDELFEYEEEGQVVATLLNYSIGFGLVIVIIIFMVVLAAQVYESQQADIALITNVDINTSVNASIEGAFDAMATFSENLDIIAIAVVFGLSLIVILGAFAGIGIAAGGGGRGGFSAI